MACDHCGYRLDRRDLEYGSCPACGSAIEGYEGIRETDSLGYTEIKDGNGKVVGKARLPRGFSTALATFTKDSSDKVRPNKMTVISESLDNSKLFYKSGECFLQVKNGLFNQGKGELGKDLSARKKNFKTPSEYLDEMAGKIIDALIIARSDEGCAGYADFGADDRDVRLFHKRLYSFVLLGGSEGIGKQQHSIIIIGMDKVKDVLLRLPVAERTPGQVKCYKDKNVSAVFFGLKAYTFERHV